MSRLRETMHRLKDEGRAALVVYLTHGDPTVDKTFDIVWSAAQAGADVIELGIPFSDPNADGPVIQRAMLRALAAGASLQSGIDLVAKLREQGCQVPVVLFGYYNPLYVYGVERFAEAAARAGVDAVLTVDLPVDEMAELHGPLSRHGLDVIPLVAPTTGLDRLARVTPLDPPFVYYISMTGVTGSTFSVASVNSERVAEVQAATGAPVAVGFGISTPEDARCVARYADGVIVGSAVVRKIQEGGVEGAAEAVGKFVTQLRQAMDSE